MRPLTAGQVQRLQALRAMAQLLDSAFVLPGTTFRIGLDPILGLVPGLGDLVSPLFTIAIIWQARDLGVPRVVLLRMVANAAIDTVVGAVPLLGDLFDAGWKANEKNFRLLERHATEEHPPALGDWLVLLALIAVVLAVAVVPFVVLAGLFEIMAG